MSMVVPFLLSRRRAFVRRHANMINGMSPEFAELHLAHQLMVQHDALKRRGIAEDRINSELASLKSVAHEQ